MLSAAAVVFLVIVSDATVRRIVQDRVAERFRRELAHLADDLARGLPGSETRDDFLRRAAADLDCRVTYIAPDGRVLDDTDLLPADVPAMENHANRPEVREATASGSGSSTRVSPTEQKPMLYVARRLPDGSVLRLAVSEGRLRDVALRSLWVMRAATLAVCLVLFLIGASASRRFSEPIAELTRAASAVAAGDFARDLPTAGGEEVQLLGGAMQRMKSALNQAVQRAESERRLTATVFERLPDGLVVVDAKLRVLEANGRFGEMTGIPAPAGRGVYEVLRERPLYDCFEATVGTGETTERIVRLPDDRVWQIAVAALPEGYRAGGGRRPARRHASRADRGDAPHVRGGRLARAAHSDRVDRRRGRDAVRCSAEQGGIGGTAGSDPAQSDRMRELIDDLMDDLMDLAQIESGAVPLVREEVRCGSS